MTAISTPISPLDHLTNHLSNRDRDRLAHGSIVVIGHSGCYEVYGLAPGSMSTAWTVISDYERFKRFLPTVVASRVLEADGNRYLVEQVDRRNVLLTQVESTILTENIERGQTQIDFRLVKGNLKQMAGFWRIDAIAAADDASINPQSQTVQQILVTQKVSVQPGIGPFNSVFFGIFERSLSENMQAICQEILKRN